MQVLAQGRRHGSQKKNGYGIEQAPVEGHLPADIQKHRHCPWCGMDRLKFDFSRMFIEYDDGSSQGTCSIRCMAVELPSYLEKTPVSLYTADIHTKQLINAETAFWTLGGKKPGVMTRRGKWAFVTEGAAQKFLEKNGGKLVTWDDAIKAAYLDLYIDTQMIRQRRKMRKKK